MQWNNRVAWRMIGEYACSAGGFGSKPNMNKDWKAEVRS